MKHRVVLLYSWLVRIATACLPDAPCCMQLRGWCYGRLMKNCGQNFQVASNVRIVGLEFFSVGNDVYLGPGTIILASDSIRLDNEVLVGPYTVITDGNHSLRNGSYRFGKRTASPVMIEQGAWVAAHCTVLPGVTVGASTVVGANSCVSRNLPANIRAAGSPARCLSKRSAA